MKPTSLFLALFALVGCEQQYTQIEKKRLLDSFPYVDCGAIAPGTREAECTVPLFSKEDGAVTVYEIATTDIDYPEGGLDPTTGTAFIVRDEFWMQEGCGEGDCLELTGYDPDSDEDTLPLNITFAPQVEGYYRAELTIWSNDSESTVKEPLPDEPDREEAVWKVELRGLAHPACGRVFPTFVDFGRRPVPASQFTEEVTLENCGIVTLAVSGVNEDGTGAEEMELTDTLTIYTLPSLSDTLHIFLTVPSTLDADADGYTDWDELSPLATDFSFASNADDTTLGAQSLTVIANNCLLSTDDSWDADSDGWFECGGDCKDNDPTVNPAAIERAGNGQDDNCDGAVDEAANPAGTDDDGDTVTELDGDCHDRDSTVFPGAIEIPNQVDDDCNGITDDNTEWYDDDGDGWSERQGDFDDASRFVYPGAPETTDGVDNDCDGVVDEGGPDYDDDQDGYTENDPTNPDCDDNDPWVYVAAFEFCDGYDNDCDIAADEGEDDAPDGACAFLPTRNDDDDDTVVEKKGCATGAGVVTPVLLGWSLVMISRRRRASA
jgi:hypothetical protein